MNIYCLIPVRKDSSRIKNKNIVKIKKKKLINYVCEKIIRSKYIQEFHILTDSFEYFNYVKSLSKKINYFKRSYNSSRKFSKTEKVIAEFFKKHKNFGKKDIAILLQITNPFINYKILDKALMQFKKSNADTMLSVSPSNKFLWKNSKFSKPLNYNYKMRKFSQKLDDYYIENGSFYIFRPKNFLKYKNRLHGRISLYKMDKQSQFELDDLSDLKIIRKII
tara:strand:- start:49 stop:711 length:663 start_codon:yes stop_codon:yes gene_type:complete